MNLHRWLAVLFVILALAGCAQMATSQGQPKAFAKIVAKLRYDHRALQPMKR
jgi:hypothetical protein